MGSAFKKFCTHFCFCYCGEDDEPEEKAPLISETLLYFDLEAKKKRDQETNLWSMPGDPSHSERDDDRELYNMLQKRARVRRGSLVHRRLSVDINNMREVRRGLKEKWKIILENLGFMEEAESLLDVSASASYDRMRNAPAARALLNTLHSETSIFNSREPPPERYMFILDRLICLDAAEDFVSKAQRFYPKGEGDDNDEDEEPTITLPVQIIRGQNEPSGDEDDELVDGHGSSEEAGSSGEGDYGSGRSLN